MARDIQRIINDYDATFENTRKANLYCTEMNALKDMSNDLFHVISNTFKFAYMVGYKAGKRRR